MSQSLRKPGIPKPDAILTTGDIAFSCATRRDDEYERADEYLRNLASTLQLTPRDIFLVPGNHDVARSTDDVVSHVLVQAIREGRESLDRLLSRPDSHTHLASRQARYFEFARRFGPSARDDKGHPFHWRHQITRGGLSMSLLGLNTARSPPTKMTAVTCTSENGR